MQGMPNPTKWWNFPRVTPDAGIEGIKQLIVSESLSFESGLNCEFERNIEVETLSARSIHIQYQVDQYVLY